MGEQRTPKPDGIHVRMRGDSQKCQWHQSDYEVVSVMADLCPKSALVSGIPIRCKGRKCQLSPGIRMDFFFHIYILKLDTGKSAMNSKWLFNHSIMKEIV